MKLYAICNIWSSIYGYLTIVSKQNTWLIQYWYSIFNWKTGISTRMELSTLYCVSFISICYFCICHWSSHVWYSASSLLVESESKLCTEKNICFPVFLAVVLKMLLNCPLKVFNLNTGRFNLETYQFLDTVKKHYGIRIECMFPDAVEVQGLVRKVRPHLLAGKI